MDSMLFVNMLPCIFIGLLHFVTSRDLCDFNPCRNGGTCSLTSDGHSYTCTCPYAGIYGPRCETNHMCSPSFNQCKNNAICHMTSQAPYYYCACAAGYSGVNCENNNNCKNNPCRNNGTCFVDTSPPYFSCQCKHGFYGPECKYIDKCITRPCPHGWDCTRSYSTYKCHCNMPLSCDSNQHEVDHCATQPCKHNGVCTSLTQAPYFRCDCSDGFSGNTCQQNDHCTVNRCSHNATCITSDDSPFYKCDCKVGFYGKQCEHIDHCLSSPCPSGSVCHESQFYHNGYHCSCPSNHAQCSTVNACLSNPCLNGNCVQTIASPFYHCKCHTGFSGIRCDHHECDSAHCNQGTCIGTNTSPYFKCSCPAGFYGHNCEHEACTPGKCHYGGTCLKLDHPPYFHCVCAKGFSGGLCSRPDVTTTKTTTAKTTATPITTAAATSTVKTPTHGPTLHGPTCLSCSEVVSPDTCEYITHCGQHESCFIEEAVNTLGSLRFNLGCRDTKQCGGMLTTRDVSDIKGANQTDVVADNPLICADCCIEELCNSGGCGTNAFPTLLSGQRGPICYHCDQQNSPDDCSKIKVCGRDEVCMLSTTSVATSQKTLLKSECLLSTLCPQPMNSLTTGINSANDGNKTCCSTDLCNDHF